MRANEIYAEAGSQFSTRSRDVLTNAQCRHKCWSTLKTAVFGLTSSFAPLTDLGGVLVFQSVGKEDILLNHFDGKQSRDSVDQPSS